MCGDYKRILVYRIEERERGGATWRRLTASFDTLLDALAWAEGLARFEIIDVENLDEGDMTDIARRMRTAVAT